MQTFTLQDGTCCRVYEEGATTYTVANGTGGGVLGVNKERTQAILIVPHSLEDKEAIEWAKECIAAGELYTLDELVQAKARRNEGNDDG